MKILQLDVDNISYGLVKPEAGIYEKSDEKHVSIDDALVMLVSVENGDNEGTADMAIEGAMAMAKQLKRQRLVVYPFAHLSNDLAEPRLAMRLIDHIYKNVPKSLDAKKAPFGWNKSLTLSIKGHPLAEQARSYGADKGAGMVKRVTAKVKQIAQEVEKDSKALQEERKVKSTWYILDTDGELTPVERFDFTRHRSLKLFADYEIKKTRAYQQIPEHIRLMQRLKLIDYEPGSDAGNMRFYPNGRLIKSLLERYVTARTVEYGAVEVETPIMYDYTHPALEDYLNRFPARHYVVKSEDKDYFLRFSACFGQFLMMHDTTISYKQLPFKMYELTRYSFRRELSGELAGLKRLRAFTMPDMHTACRDLEQAKDEFKKQFEFCQSVLAGIGIVESEYEAAIRFTEDFWKENKTFVMNLVKSRLKKPALIEMWSFRYAYFDPKFEFNVIDSMNKASALSTVQIDHENGKRYEVNYVDANGKKEHPILLHCSPSGAIERVIYALLELSAIKNRNGKIPILPLWLAPTQVRFIPISEKHSARVVELAMELKKSGIRSDVDDTDDTLDKKIRNAEVEWVPYICVIGDKELHSGLLSVRGREDKKQESIKLEVLKNKILEKTGSMPVGDLTLPMLLSRRPIFVG